MRQVFHILSAFLLVLSVTKKVTGARSIADLYRASASLLCSLSSCLAYSETGIVHRHTEDAMAPYLTLPLPV